MFSFLKTNKRLKNSCKKINVKKKHKADKISCIFSFYWFCWIQSAACWEKRFLKYDFVENKYFSVTSNKLTFFNSLFLGRF